MGILRLLRVRLTLWYVALLALTLAAFSAGVYVALRESLYTNLDDSIETRSELVSALVTADGDIDVTGVEIPGDPVEGEEFVRVFDASGEVLLDNSAAAFRPPEDPAAVEAALHGETTRRGLAAGGVDLRVMTAPVRADGRVVGAIEVGLSEGDIHDTLSRLLLIIAALYPVALLVVGGGGVFLAGRALRPIDEVTLAARQISAEDLGRRLDLALPNDEVGRLARTFDGMIARLDEAFQRQRQFTADASHELRTPLTAIKGQAEVALQRERAPEEYREALRRVNEEVDRMIRLLGSLLTLARADAAQIEIEREPVSLERLAGDAMEQLRPAAAEKRVTVTPLSSADIVIRADHDLLLQLLLNLLDNAVKYTPEGGTVEVSWRPGAGRAEISVRDTGPGIAPEHLTHVFDRFYRVDAARSRAEGGAGLGLSICRWIAEAHGGAIRAESPPGGGARFTVSLPLA